MLTHNPPIPIKLCVSSLPANRRRAGLPSPTTVPLLQAKKRPQLGGWRTGAVGGCIAPNTTLHNGATIALVCSPWAQPSGLPRSDLQRDELATALQRDWIVELSRPTLADVASPSGRTQCESRSAFAARLRRCPCCTRDRARQRHRRCRRARHPMVDPGGLHTPSRSPRTESSSFQRRIPPAAWAAVICGTCQGRSPAQARPAALKVPSRGP
jgi:hypothetical protein